jgi:hypothetical protein
MGRELSVVGWSRAVAECLLVLLIDDVAREQDLDRAVVHVHSIDMTLRVVAVGETAGDDPRRAWHLDQVFGIGHSADEHQPSGGIAGGLRGGRN